MVPLAYDRRYDLDLTSAAWDARRAQRIISFLASAKLLRSEDLLPARPISMRRLRHVHTDAYLESLQQRDALTGLLGFSVTDRQQDEVLASHRAMVGGTLRAAETALGSGEIAANLGGGFHHALADRGQGFCAFNDVAISIADLRGRGFAGPILVADLDLHDGDGTRSIFSSDPTVHTLSIHNRDLGSTDAVASTSLELGAGVADSTYLAAVRELVPELVAAIAPKLIFYLAGTDPAADDALGNWHVSDDGLFERDRIVVESARQGEIPLVFVLAGGYGQRAWRHSAATLSWLAGGRRLEPPTTSELAMRHYRRLARTLSVGELTTDPAGADWNLTDEDLLPGSAPTRFLGFYSQHGLELGLERLGLLDRLRSKGFDRLGVEIDVSDPVVHAARIRTEEPGAESLIELRLRRDRAVLRGFELLFIDWLLVQDPRRSFSAERPRLPGQRHPGLGVLRDIAALQWMICERLQLDGLAFVPTHYHVAAQVASHAFHFRSAESQGRFTALLKLLRPLHLIEAVQAVEEGRVVDRTSGSSFTWEPETMILPVSAELQRVFASEERGRLVAAAARAADFVLLQHSGPDPPQL